jgi:ribokinase
LARLERKVGFIGKIGRDSEGRMLTEDFDREGVDTKGIIIAKYGRSGKVMGFVDIDGQRALYIDPGVNDVISFKEIDIKYASNARFLHLTSFVGDKSFQAQKKLLEKLPEKVKVSFDPGALYARGGIIKLKPIIDKTYLLMPNAGELALLTGRTDYKMGAKLLLNKGVRVLAVKLGSKGCYVTDGKEDQVVEPFRVKVVDTTGAGDAFDAGFILGLLLQKSLYEAGKIGNFVASKCIATMGARPGLPTLEVLEANQLV